METALNEITLVLFTTIAPAGLMGYVVIAAFGLVSPREELAGTASRYLVIPLTLVITGLIASATHLGTPANALYVVTGIGRSPLSNEVAAVVAFLALGGIYWLAAFRDDWTTARRRLCLTIVTVAAVVACQAIAYAYAVDTVPTWNLPLMPVSLWLGAIPCGVSVGLLTLLVANLRPSHRFVWACFAIGAVAAVADGVVLLTINSQLEAIATTAQQASALAPALPVAATVFSIVSIAALATSTAIAVSPVTPATTGPAVVATMTTPAAAAAPSAITPSPATPVGTTESPATTATAMTTAAPSAITQPQTASTSAATTAPTATTPPARGAAPAATSPTTSTLSPATEVAPSDGQQARWGWTKKAIVCACGLLMLAACFAVRFCFYALYMTAGV